MADHWTREIQNGSNVKTTNSLLKKLPYAVTEKTQRELNKRLNTIVCIHTTVISPCFLNSAESLHKINIILG